MYIVNKENADQTVYIFVTDRTKGGRNERII